MYLHTSWGVALAMLPGGLQPGSLWAMRLHGRLGRDLNAAGCRYRD